MNMQIFGITFAAAERALILVPLLAGVAILSAYKFFWQQRAANMLTAAHLSHLLRNFCTRTRFLKAALVVGGTTMLALALLRPQWNKREEVIAQEGRDLFIALDISRSMLATDCEPNRLACAKQKIKQLLGSLSCERAGLILFSGSAFVQCPLTADFAAFKTFLDHVDVETISSGTTALDQALKTALRAFDGMENKKNKIVAIFTDGEDFSSNLRHYKQQAHEQGLHIFTFGVGTGEGAPIPLYDSAGNQVGHQKNNQGNIVISRLNEGILETLAQDAGGHYLRMTQDADDVETLARHVHAFEKEQFEDTRYSAYEDQYHWFLLAGFIMLALEWLV